MWRRSFGEHTSAYVSIRQHTSAYVSIRPQVKYVAAKLRLTTASSAYVSTRNTSASQHTSACRYLLLTMASSAGFMSNEKVQSPTVTHHTPARTSAYVSTRQHTSAYVSKRQWASYATRRSSRRCSIHRIYSIYMYYTYTTSRPVKRQPSKKGI